jgi:hypothetical protein
MPKSRGAAEWLPAVPDLGQVRIDIATPIGSEKTHGPNIRPTTDSITHVTISVPVIIQQPLIR